MSLGSHDIGFLKETLHAQQELLQKLYNELDVERESSAIAADEALSMILRLQGEKSAMEMEASQYKRIAEEKMCHAQETVELFQEFIYHKEMLIASLEFQVQAYRFKIQSLGVDLGSCEMQYPENMLSRRNSCNGETSGQSYLKRGSSLPPLVLDAMSRRGSTGELKSSPKGVKEHVSGGHNSYWDEISKLEERVRELGNFKNNDEVLTPTNSKAISESSSANLPISTLPICKPSPESLPLKSNNAGEATSRDSQCSSTVHDIFEVPQCPFPTPDDSFLNKYKSFAEDEGEAKKVDLVWDEILKSDKEKIDEEKKPLLSPVSMNDSPNNPRDINEKIDGKKRPLLSPCKSNEIRSKDTKSNEKHSLFKHPTCGVADFELQQFNRRLKQLEDGRFARRGRDINVESINEELKLLREILDKVDEVQVELTNRRPNKAPSKESVGCIKEAMLCFWP